jgi:hypothetical protein
MDARMLAGVDFESAAVPAVSSPTTEHRTEVADDIDTKFVGNGLAACGIFFNSPRALMVSRVEVSIIFGVGGNINVG